MCQITTNGKAGTNGKAQGGNFLEGNQSIILKARELARALAESNAVERFREAERRFLNDDAAQKLMEQLSAARQAVQTRSVDEPAGDLLGHIADLQAKLQANKAYSDYAAAAAGVSELLANVNAIITFPLTGEVRTGGCPGCGVARSLPLTVEPGRAPHMEDRS